MWVSWRKQTLDNCKYLSELFAQTGYKQLWDYKIKNQPPSMSQVDFPQTVRLISLDCKKTQKSIVKAYQIRLDQIRSVAQSCPTLCNPMNHSTPGLPVHHQLPEFTQTHVH